MMTRGEFSERQRQMLDLFRKAGIVTTAKERKRIEIADFGLGRFEKIGLGLLVYVNTERCCAKELAMLPRQICPEHRHPPLGKANPGKEETFRCRWGRVTLYVPGKPTGRKRTRIPAGKRNTFTVWHAVELRPGQQYTLGSNTLHWFQAGPKGAIVSEFSTASVDAADVFTDPQIQRITKVVERA